MKSVVVNGMPRLIGGCRPDTPNERDWVMKLPAPAGTRESLRSRWTLPIRNQGRLGTCVANGTLEGGGFLWTRDGLPDPELSRLFLYYAGRVKIEGVPATEDSGLQIRDGVLAFRRFGACLESLWPYSDDPTTFTKEPPQTCWDAAVKHEALFFYRCPDLNTIKASISQGFPVVMGFQVFDSFLSQQTATTGIITMPKPGENTDGGHCMVFAGWDDSLQQLEGPNSWDVTWGDQGWFHMPYAMVEQGIVSDCWTLRRVQE